MIISKTPLRISFAGGGTDLRSFYKKNKYGAVLSTAIDSYIYVSIKKQPFLFEEKYRLNYSETELVQTIDEIRNPIIRECLRFLDIDDQIYISTIADVPASTGLGSSSTFCVGLLNALYKFKKEVVSAGRLAEEASYIECDVLKRPMGKQDHYAAAYGGFNYIRFYNDESVTIRPLSISGLNLKKLLESILIFWTGITRPSESVLKEQEERKVINENVLLKMREQAKYLAGVLTQENMAVNEVGRVLNSGWELKKSLASNVTTSLIDEWYRAAIDNGAYGGKISGAGGGGFFTFIAEPKNHSRLIKTLNHSGIKRYNCGFDASGTTVTEIK